jgi:hypothetical protein
MVGLTNEGGVLGMQHWGVGVDHKDMWAGGSNKQRA